MVPRRVLRPSLLVLTLGAALSAHSVTYTLAVGSPTDLSYLSFTATLASPPTVETVLEASDLSALTLGPGWGPVASYTFALGPNETTIDPNVSYDRVSFEYAYSLGGGGGASWYFAPGTFAKLGTFDSRSGAGDATLTVVPEPASFAGLALGALALRRRTRRNGAFTEGASS